MNITLTPIHEDEKYILIELYRIYMEELEGFKNPDGHKYLNLYWKDNSRLPFYIRKNNNIVGFLLVNNYTLVEPNAKSVAEMYIDRKFRRKGMGREAAFQILDMFPGKWEVRQKDNNIVGQRFWRNIIKTYTNNDYKEERLDDDKWKGPVQTFES